MRRLLNGLLPGGALLACALGLRAWASPTLLEEVTRGYPWVACAAAFLLAALFHRSRAAVASVAVGLGAWALAAGWPPAVVGTALALVITVLAPTADRGIATAGALAQWGAAGAVLGLGAMLVSGGAPEVAALLDPAAPGGALGLPPAQIFVYAAALASVMLPLLRRHAPLERALLWCLLAVFAGAHPRVGEAAAPVFFLAAGLILALSLVETSYAMAYRDELTGLPGRRALVRDLEALGAPYALAMVDVDHFKKFNDKHGHDVGDQVLRLVASRLARAPGGARAYRYGGEEFTLLLPGRGRDEALPHLEEVRRSVEGARFALRSWKRPLRKPRTPRHSDGEDRRQLSVTVSIGVAEAPPGSGGWPEVLKKADKALYRAKRAGRNRVAK